MQAALDAFLDLTALLGTMQHKQKGFAPPPLFPEKVGKTHVVHVIAFILQQL